MPCLYQTSFFLQSPICWTSYLLCHQCSRNHVHIRKNRFQMQNKINIQNQCSFSNQGPDWDPTFQPVACSRSSTNHRFKINYITSSEFRDGDDSMSRVYSFQELAFMLICLTQLSLEFLFGGSWSLLIMFITLSSISLTTSLLMVQLKYFMHWHADRSLITMFSYKEPTARAVQNPQGSCTSWVFQEGRNWCRVKNLLLQDT